MKLKIDNKIIDANIEPIMLVFENELEKIVVGQHILNMFEGNLKYCMFPENMNDNDVREFMKISSITINNEKNI